MTQVNTSFGGSIARMLLRHVLSGVGAALVAKGVLDESSAGAFTDIAAGGVLFAGAAIWSAIRTSRYRELLGGQ